MAEERYIKITEGMLELGLNNSELHALALVKCLTKDGTRPAACPIWMFEKWCNLNKRRALDVVNNLAEKGYFTIKKGEDDQRVNVYELGAQIGATIGATIAPKKVQLSTQIGAIIDTNRCNNCTTIDNIDNKDKKGEGDNARAYTREDIPTTPLFLSKNFNNSWKAVCQSEGWRDRPYSAKMAALITLKSFNEATATAICIKTLRKSLKDIYPLDAADKPLLDSIARRIQAEYQQQTQQQ